MSLMSDFEKRLERAGVASGRRGHGYTGEAVYIFAYDIAYEISDEPIDVLLGQPIVQYAAGMTKRGPREPFFYRPRMIRLPEVTRRGPRGPVPVQRTVKIYPVGAISITVRVHFDVAHAQDLVAFHDLYLDKVLLHDEVNALAEQVRRELLPFCTRPVAQLHDDEAYTVFCIRPPLTTGAGQPVRSEDWLAEHRREVAAVLTQETDIAYLSDQEAEESTGKYLSYYEYDLAVLDWDAALVVDAPANMDETIHIIELANVQLAELEAYDRILDEAMDHAYRDLRSRPLRGQADVLRGLRELRIDLARLSDELSNITKFFGDWHLARIYQKLSARFHLEDWERVINEKLKTVDDLYMIFRQDQNNRWMMALELSIVVLFIIDLVILVWFGMK